MNAAKQLYTVDDWLSLPDDDRCELIDGDLVHKAMPSVEHGLAQSAIITTLKSEYQWKRKGPKGWWLGTEISVVYEGRSNGFTHDIVGWKRENYPEKPQGKKTSARPDWICEILSLNRKTDLETKRWVLHEHRVPYYWLVDLDAEIVSVLEWSEKGYVIILDAKKGENRILPPFDMEFAVSVFLGNEPD